MLRKMTSTILIMSISLILVSCQNTDISSVGSTSIETSLDETNNSATKETEDSSTNETSLDKSTKAAEMSDDSAATVTTESTPSIIPQDKTQNNGYISKDELLSLFKLKKPDILTKLGDTYDIVLAGAEDSYDGYRYKGLGIVIAFDADDTIAFIDCDENVNIDGAKTGMNFAQIQEKLGMSKVKETWIETPEHKAYEITYTMGDCIISFMSQEKDGTDCGLSLYKKR